MNVTEKSQFNRGLNFTVRGPDGSIRQVYDREEPVAYLRKRTIIKDAEGRVKSDTGDQPSHSYTFNFIRILEHYLRTSAGYACTAKDITNTTRTLTHPSGGDSNFSAYMFHVKALEDDATYGIVVGTSDAAETNMDYALGTKIAQGNGAGQLEYGPMSFVAPTVNGSYIDYVLIRSLYNNSGAPITAKEFGVYTAKRDAGSDRIYCFIRDVDAAGKTVDHGDTMTVQYTLRVGAGFTKQWWELLAQSFEAPRPGEQDFTDDVYQAILDITNTPRAHLMYFTTVNWADNRYLSSLDINGPDNSDVYGLIVGSGTNAESLTNYALQTKIAHGSEAGQLDYNATAFITAAEVAGNVDLIVSRSYYNNTAAPIVIKEVAWYAHVNRFNGIGYYGGEWRVICVIRDALGAGVTINPGDSGTVQYTLRSNIGV